MESSFDLSGFCPSPDYFNNNKKKSVQKEIKFVIFHYKFLNKISLYRHNMIIIKIKKKKTEIREILSIAEIRIHIGRDFYMCRVFPKLIPLWLAPLLLPYCKLMMAWPARSCSSVNCRSFFSASLGPMAGFPYLYIWNKLNSN